eukprot:GHVP01058583.1.p1 GENE.GHVP01058583.1~~GHVP01058583.1.p1  ORF type:complete len:311 (+),score=59.86 GHVP01058583.1:1473-2405(+)
MNIDDKEYTNNIVSQNTIYDEKEKNQLDHKDASSDKMEYYTQKNLLSLCMFFVVFHKQIEHNRRTCDALTGDLNNEKSTFPTCEDIYTGLARTLVESIEKDSDFINKVIDFVTRSPEYIGGEVEDEYTPPKYEESPWFEVIIDFVSRICSAKGVREKYIILLEKVKEVDSEGSFLDLDIHTKAAILNLIQESLLLLTEFRDEIEAQQLHRETIVRKRGLIIDEISATEHDIETNPTRKKKRRKEYLEELNNRKKLNERENERLPLVKGVFLETNGKHKIIWAIRSQEHDLYVAVLQNSGKWAVVKKPIQK